MRKVSIDKLNEKIGNQVANRAKKEYENKEAIFASYEELQQEGKTVRVRFDACDVNGTFTKYDDCGVLVVLPGTSVYKAKKNVNVYATAKMLGIELNLKVKQVDRENGKIVCELPATVTTRGMIQNAIQREIFRAVKEGNSPIVWGRIKSVTRRRAIVDILNQGVIGIIDASHWQRCYTRQLCGMCEVGDFYQFEVIKQEPKLKDKPAAWTLSRKNITEDAWSLIDFEALHPGGTLLVKCIERPIGKSYWWGVSDRTPGIEIMGDYTTKLQSGKRLLEGITYLCKIREVEVAEGDHKRNRFTVVPFDIVPEDAATVAGFQQLQSSSKSNEG